MRVNENTAVSTAEVLLVPYDRHHVPKYHAWMEDPAIQEATASEPLSLEEEYENQQSWRAAGDKLTFILCQPTADLQSARESGSSKEEQQQQQQQEEEEDEGEEKWFSAGMIRAGHEDRPERMLGDINFILHADDEYIEEDGSDGDPRQHAVVGEVDIMIADAAHRGRGLGTAAARALLHYTMRDRRRILAEFDGGRQPEPGLVRLVAKIKAGNAGSIALFRSLGFEQEGGVNYFGEVHMALEGGRLDRFGRDAPDGYVEVIYSRDGDVE